MAEERRSDPDTRSRVDVIQERVDRFIRRSMPILWLVVLLLVVAGVQELRLHDAQTTATHASQDASRAAREAANATNQLAIVTGENRGLIARLDRVAEEAQRRGARAIASVCRKVDRLRADIRSVLMQSGQGGAQFLPRFRPDQECEQIRDARPVRP